LAPLSENSGAVQLEINAPIEMALPKKTAPK